jgi:hypothetical protein
MTVVKKIQLQKSYIFHGVSLNFARISKIFPLSYIERIERTLTINGLKKINTLVGKIKKCTKIQIVIGKQSKS